MNLKTNPELYPLVEWWEKDGRQTVIWLLVAAIAVGGWYGWKNHRIAVRNAASEAVVNAYTTEELEEAAAKFAGSPSAGALKLRLAKSYYDAGRFEEAMAQYDALAPAAPDGFAEVPAVGKAQCLEALGRLDEALAAYDAFSDANPKSCLALTAQLGSARVLVRSGDKAKALSRLDAMKAANKGDELAVSRIEAVESLARRFVAAEAPKAN